MSELTTPTKSSESAAGGSPSIVSRKVGAGIQARLAKLQGATGAPVVAREVPRKFANGYDEPFRERLDGTLRRSLSGTWSVGAFETENTSASASTDGSQTLVEIQPISSLPTVSEEAELKRRRDFTKRWEKQQEAVAEQLLTPEPLRIQSSPQPIIEEPEPEPESEEQTPDSQPAPATPIQAPPPEDTKHGILTPPISEPESTPVRKTAPKSTVRPHTTGPATRVRARPVPQAPSPTPTATTATTAAPKTPTRSRPRASAPSLAPPPVPRLHLTPSPSRTTPRVPSVPPRSQTSLSTRRVSAPASVRPRLSTKIPDRVLPPPVRPRTISKVYEGPTLSSLAKQKPLVSPGMASRAVSRADFTS